LKVVILAGGLGTRISEESITKPKPMVEIGSKPIIWHIMKTYSHYGLNDFIICCGYRGYLIKEYFVNYSLHTSDLTVDLSKDNNEIIVHKKKTEPWKITLVDTGEKEGTAERISKIQNYIDDVFCLTYGDGLANVNINELIKFHRDNKRDATVLAVQPPGRFGVMEIKNNLVSRFLEKPLGDGSWINGGFFVLNKNIFQHIKKNSVFWEREPLSNLSEQQQLVAFKFEGFWHAMDTLRDKNYLESLWSTGKAPWKVWND
jgi:glucose-1-phosphate cytidylyltransferase